jgi:hypothetical protein
MQIGLLSSFGLVAPYCWIDVSFTHVLGKRAARGVPSY